jgi:hypothetical protein
MSNTAEEWAIRLGMENDTDPLAHTSSENEISIDPIIKTTKKKVTNKKRKERSSTESENTNPTKKFSLQHIDTVQDTTRTEDDRMTITSIMSSDDDTTEHDFSSGDCSATTGSYFKKITHSSDLDSLGCNIIDLVVNESILIAITVKFHEDFMLSHAYTIGKLYSITEFVTTKDENDNISNHFCKYLESNIEFRDIYTRKFLRDSFIAILLENIKNRVFSLLSNNNNGNCGFQNKTFALMMMDMFLLQFK